MCIAIVKPSNVDIGKETLRICADNNPDGCGFAYVNEDDRGVRRIKVRKAMGFEEFYTKYSKCLSMNTGSTFLIHFRIKTHGHVDLANCHPFKIDRNHVFIHNGTISKVDKVDGMSDTRVFNRDVLRVLPKNWNGQTGIKKLIEEFIGYSKLCVMDINGNVNIYNEKKGEWKDGIWFSNNGYKAKPVFTPIVSKPFNYSSNIQYGSSKKRGATDMSKVHSNIENNPNRRKNYTHEDYIPCDLCGVYHNLTDHEAYWKEGSVVTFCQSCTKGEDVWYYFDPEDTMTLDSHVDWLNSLDEDEDIELYHDPGEWVDPWGFDDYSEAQEDVYQLTLAQA